MKYYDKYYNKITKIEKLDIFKNYVKGISQYKNQIIKSQEIYFFITLFTLNYELFVIFLSKSIDNICLFLFI